MRLIINVREKNSKDIKEKMFNTVNELVNAVCGTLDANMFEVEYVDHELEYNEALIDEGEQK